MILLLVIKNPISKLFSKSNRVKNKRSLQLAIHVVQNRRAGEQKSRWDKTNRENYHFKLCISFVCLVQGRLLLSSVAVLYHAND